MARLNVRRPRGDDPRVATDEDPQATSPADSIALEVAAPDAADAPPAKRIRLPRTFDSFFDREFRWFYISMLGNMAAMNMQLVIRGLLAYILTGSYAALGLVGLANALPMLALSMFGGVIADRYPKRTVMQIGQAASMVNAAALAGLWFADQMTFGWLIASAAAHGITMSLMMPSRQAMIPEVVAHERMMNAISLNMAGMNSMRLFAPALGGFIVALFGFGWAFATMAGLFGLAIIGMAQVTWKPASAPGASGQSPLAVGKSAMADIGGGFSYMWRDRTMLVILVFAFVTTMFGMPLQFLLPGYAADIFADDPADAAGIAGLLLSVSAIGALAGALLLATIPAKRRGWLLLAGAMILGLGTFLFPQSLNVWVAGLAMIVVGLGSAFRQALSQGLLHAYVDNAYRGRVMAIFMTQMSVMQFGTFVVGVIAETTGIRVVVAGLGICLMVVTVLWAIAVPRIRRLD